MIIGIMANGPGAGKTTAADFLATLIIDRELHPVVCPFAESLKNTCRSIGWDGEKDAKGRVLLDTLGMAGREYNENLWVKLWKKNNESSIYDPNMVILVDDVRFANEVSMIRNLGGKIVRVERTGVERPDLRSEGYTITDPDGIFYNNGSQSELYFKIKEWLGIHL